jgi:hypothetical protein
VEEDRPVMAVEMLVIGLVVVVLVAVLARLAWVMSHRGERPSITEAQGRENAAPLTTAVVGATGRARETQES